MKDKILFGNIEEYAPDAKIENDLKFGQIDEIWKAKSESITDNGIFDETFDSTFE